MCLIISNIKIYLPDPMSLGKIVATKIIQNTIIQLVIHAV